MNKIKNTNQEKPQTFSQRLRALMAEKGITVKLASEICGVAPSTVQCWRTQGAYPAKPEAIKRLADHLNVSPAWLLLGEGAEPTRDKVAEKKAWLLEITTTGKDRSRTDKTKKQIIWDNQKSYDAEFTAEIRKLRPDWFAK